KHVPPDCTGQLLGAIGLLHALARVISPTLFNLIYSLTVGSIPQAVFMCLSIVFGVALLLTWFIKPHGTSKIRLQQQGESVADSFNSLSERHYAYRQKY